MRIHSFDDDLDDDTGCRCPITQEIMRDPVICADGHSYDRGAINAWLQAHDTSPLTGQRLEHKQLVPNHALRGIIAERRTRRRGSAATAAEGSGLSGGSSGWRIDPSRLEVTDKVLGRGAWGVVRLGKLRDGEGADRTDVAVKMLPEAPSSVTENLETEFETIAFATLRCSHVCRLIGTCLVEGTCALVMKLYECSLHDLLEGAPGRRLPLCLRRGGRGASCWSLL